MNILKQKEGRLAALGALTAYTSIFCAFFGFIGVTFTLLISSGILSFKAIGRQRLRQFFTDLIGPAS